MIRKLASLLPDPLYLRLKKFKWWLQERAFRWQGIRNIKVGDYLIVSPAKHTLSDIMIRQPYRDLNIGVVAKFVSEKYPRSAIIDVGANIGDTAAVICSWSKNKLICIEASDYFYNFLERNVQRFPNEIVTKMVLIGDGQMSSGQLRHWGGTAFFQEQIEDNKITKTERLCHVTNEPVCFVKMDIDGLDFKVLKDNIEWLGE